MLHRPDKRPLNILFAHNTYLTPGGEDESVRAEIEMLNDAGHRAELWQVSNEAISQMGRLAAGASAVWSFDAVRELKRRLAAGRFDVLHVQNHFPLLSPAIHRVAAAAGVATVQHLRNYRMMCVNGSFFRDGHVCNDCAASFAPWRGAMRGCYRDSKTASLVPAAMVAAHRVLGTFSRTIDAYVAISDHVRDAHVAAGYPQARIHTRYNTVAAPKAASGGPRRPSIVVPSRLTAEKGVDIVIAAWRQRRRVGTLHIAGTGPEEARLRSLAGGDASIYFEGQMPHQRLMTLMAEAHAVVNASLWDEPFGRTPMEAFSVATPAIVTTMGGLTEIVEHGRNGLHVAPGSIDALDAAMTALLEDAGKVAEMGAQARESFEAKFSTAAILPQTEAIYARAIERRESLSGGGRQGRLAHV